MSELDYGDDESNNDLIGEDERESDEDTEDASETDMLKTESEYMEIREQIYRDKLGALKEQLKQIDDGTQAEYARKLLMIEHQYDERLLLNDAFLAVEIERIEQEFVAEKRAAAREFEDRKLELRENLIAELEEKRKSIENEKISLEFNSDPYEPKPATTRKLRRRPNDPTPAPEKRKRGSPAQLNQLLEEHEIFEDLKLINRAIANSSKAAAAAAAAAASAVAAVSSSAATVSAAATSATNNAEMNGTTTGSGASGAKGTADKDKDKDADKHVDARIDDGKLFYEKKWFHRGQQVVIKCSDSSEFSGVLASIGSAEVCGSYSLPVLSFLPNSNAMSPSFPNRS
jgi:Sin3 histone deacetylase corepressor complex component SDS3